MIKTCQYLSGASTLILSEVCQKCISISDWGGEHLTGKFIILSHFRLCFLADKWHLLPKPSGWSPLLATTALLGWAPNIHHNALCLPVCLTLFAYDFGVSKRLQRWVATALSLCICCLVPKLVTESLWRMIPQHHTPVHSCKAATQQLCQTECRHGLALTR